METGGPTRRGFLKSVLGAAAGAAMAGVDGAEPAFGRVRGLAQAPGKRPNILYIHSHDTGRFTGPYGHQVHTPNLQQLAVDGIRFTQAFCGAPTCSPSRASLLTGQYPHSNGMFGLVNRGFRMTAFDRHILHTLRREAGYYSALVGLQHIAPDPAEIGYDKFEVIPGDHVEEVAPAAVQFLHNRPNKPFWLEVGFFETHRPFRQANQEDDPRYVLPPAPVPDVDATRQDTAEFCASIRKLDWGVGQVLAALEKEGLAENTLVISTTDHGPAFPEMKCNLYDGGMGVHLIMRGPGGFHGGKLCEAMVSQVDLFPTLCDLLDIPHPNWLQGRSFLPVIRGTQKEVNDQIYGEVNYHGSYEPMRAVRTKQWKYIHRFGDYPRQVLPNCDDGLSKTYWVEHGWGKKVVSREELYDLTFDPNERNNLASQPAHQERLGQMRRLLNDWMVATADPLLTGPVKVNRGAMVNPPNEVSGRKEPLVPVTTIQ